MIAFSYEDKQSFLAVFPERCLKATPDPEFLSNLYGFDMSLCPHRTFFQNTPPATEVFKEIFDAINSTSRVPELIVWMTSQVCPTTGIIMIVLFILNDFCCTSVETP